MSTSYSITKLTTVEVDSGWVSDLRFALLPLAKIYADNGPCFRYERLKRAAHEWYTDRLWRDDAKMPRYEAVICVVAEIAGV